MNEDDLEKIKRLLDNIASAASGAPGGAADDIADHPAWMDELEDRIDEFIERMNQLKNRIGLMNAPTDQLDDIMRLLEKRTRRLDRTARRLLGEKIGSPAEPDDE
jgi:predicted phage gp36 major capsid-like protein